MQYMIFLTDGENESCALISGNKENAENTFRNMKKIIKRKNAWLELREYESYNTEEYKVVDK